MDNTQNNGMDPQQSVNDGMQQTSTQGVNASVDPVMDQSPVQPMSSMGDLVGMTPPPPAPMQDMSAPAPVSMPEPAPVAPVLDTAAQTPSVPTSPVGDMNAGMSMPQPMQSTSDMTSMNPMPAATPASEQPADDYAYAEDLLDEILDSLDRIESKLEAIEKKIG